MSLWAEEISESNMVSKAWPRAGAFAERMWSDKTVNNADEAGPRLARFSCRLNFRGVGSSPISPGSCYHR